MERQVFFKSEDGQRAQLTMRATEGRYEVTAEVYNNYVDGMITAHGYRTPYIRDARWDFETQLDKLQQLGYLIQLDTDEHYYLSRRRAS